jgi:hypothetical protein
MLGVFAYPREKVQSRIPSTISERIRVLTTASRKPPLRTDKFLGFRGELLRKASDAEVKVRRIRLLRTF